MSIKFKLDPAWQEYSKKVAETTGLTPPWIEYVTLLKIVLCTDDIHIKYDPNENPNDVHIYVDSLDKAYALQKKLPGAISFGNFTLRIIVIPSNENDDDVTLFKAIFKDSPIVKDILSIKPDGTTNAFTYILFNNEVVQYWNDNLGNPHGYSFALYENLANDIFDENHDGVLFTTASSKDE